MWMLLLLSACASLEEGGAPDAAPAEARFSFVSDGDATGWALVGLDRADSPVGVRGVWRSGVLDGAEVALESPEAGEIHALNASAPNSAVAIYSPMSFDDANGDGVPGEGEVWRGAGLDLLVWVAEAAPADRGPLGWNLWTVDPAAAQITVYAAAEGEILFPANLDPIAPLVISGPGPAGTDARVAAIGPGSDSSTGYDDSTVAADGTWSLTLTDAPPVYDRYAASEIAPEMTYVRLDEYDDVDASGAWSAGDVPLATSCLANGSACVMAIWYGDVTDVAVGWRTAWFGMRSGWQLAELQFELWGVPDGTAIKQDAGCLAGRDQPD